MFSRRRCASLFTLTSTRREDREPDIARFDWRHAALAFGWRGLFRRVEAGSRRSANVKFDADGIVFILPPLIGVPPPMCHERKPRGRLAPRIERKELFELVGITGS